MLAGDLPNQPLERQLPHQQVGALLITPDLAQGDCAGAVAAGVLHSAGGWGGFAGCFGGELFARGFAASTLAGGLFGAGHLLEMRLWVEQDD